MTGAGARRRRLGEAALAAAVLALAPAARAQAPGAITVSVDATGAGTPLERVWAFHGYDEINYTTTAEGESLLVALAAAHTAPVHVRSHFLFNTGDGTPSLKWGSTNVYTEDAAGNPVYDWALTDGILDAVTSAGAFPLVELGFMPQALSSHPDPYVNSTVTSLDGGCFYPPADDAKWGALVRAWAAHVNGRYPDVSASWLWELWNEPDIGYWHGTFADYATLYDHTEAALHGVLPDAVLGGPAVANPGGDFLTQFLQHCATGTNAVTGATGTRLDLVSFHAKGGTGIVDGHVEMDLGNQLRLHQSGFAAVAAFPQYRRTPIYITEADPDGCAACPSTRIAADAYRLSPAYGAYELAMMKRSLELEARTGVALGGVLTWAFTFPGTPYFAGYRALATNGVHLPVLGAFELLGRLAGTRLPLTSSGARPLDDILANGVRGDPDVDGMAAVNGDGIQVLVWNYHDDLVDADDAPVHLSVKVPARFGPTARVSHLRVDASHGDAYTVWVAQGMPASPTADQMTALQAAMDPGALGSDEDVAVAADGAIGMDFTLPRFGVSLVTLVPVDGETGADPAAPAGGGCACTAGGGRVGARGIAGALLLIALSRRRRGPGRLCRRLRI